ncbi:TolC family protein [Faecalibacter sp. LW9]|uniref:TolC family protein n=1 Tax=Faecalibacter sp. LW9 TaxID=3103144 RepID=UPI002AFF7487|nr:TolC family protein [Faecalibacter sp. LW9]
MYYLKRLFFLFFLLEISPKLLGQQVITITIDEALQLAIKNHAQLKVTKQQVIINEQEKEITKLNQLPIINTSIKASYLGDVDLFDGTFSKVMTQEIPHFGNSLEIQASQLIYKGGIVKNSIEAQELKIDLTKLSLENDEQTIKKTVLDYFLNNLRLENQIKIFNNNIELANQRLANVTQFYNQGITTRNEVLRAELLVKNLEQTLLSLKNNKAIIDYNLSILLNFPKESIFTLDTSNQEWDLLKEKDYYIKMAFLKHPSLLKLEKQLLLSDKQIEIIKSEKYPTIALFAGFNSQRPITTRVPALDLYANAWQTGISISYNIDNLYKTKEKQQLGVFQKQQLEYTNTVLTQNIEMSVNSAYLKYFEAIKQAEIIYSSLKLAEENYKISLAKFLNQLIIQTEMIDASNTKLEIELSLNNAEINIISQYYNLIYTTGTL